jgi:hypothetical protein
MPTVAATTAAAKADTIAYRRRRRRSARRRDAAAASVRGNRVDGAVPLGTVIRSSSRPSSVGISASAATASRHRSHEGK